MWSRSIVKLALLPVFAFAVTRSAEAILAAWALGSAISMAAVIWLPASAPTEAPPIALFSRHRTGEALKDHVSQSRLVGTRAAAADPCRRNPSGNDSGYFYIAFTTRSWSWPFRPHWHSRSMPRVRVLPAP